MKHLFTLARKMIDGQVEVESERHQTASSMLISLKILREMAALKEISQGDCWERFRRERSMMPAWKNRLKIAENHFYRFGCTKEESFWQSPNNTAKQCAHNNVRSFVWQRRYCAISTGDPPSEPVCCCRGSIVLFIASVLPGQRFKTGKIQVLNSARSPGQCRRTIATY